MGRDRIRNKTKGEIGRAHTRLKTEKVKAIPRDDQEGGDSGVYNHTEEDCRIPGCARAHTVHGIRGGD